LRSFDLGDLGDLRRGSGIFFKNYIFEISAYKERDEACLSFLVKIFTKFLHRGGVLDQSNLPGEKMCLKVRIFPMTVFSDDGRSFF
jgi:hypothetical protein